MSLNWLDYFILIFVVISILYGAARGFIHSLFKFIGLIASIIITKLYYSHVAEFIIDNTKIVSSINAFLTNKNLSSDNFNSGFMEVFNIMVPVEIMIDGFSNYLTMLLINTIALVATFFVIRLCILLLELLLKEVFKLPILNILNYMGGAILGFIGSVFILLLIFTLITPMSVFNNFDYISRAIEESSFSGYFYSYNFILKWILENTKNAVL